MMNARLHIFLLVVYSIFFYFISAWQCAILVEWYDHEKLFPREPYFCDSQTPEYLPEETFHNVTRHSDNLRILMYEMRKSHSATAPQCNVPLKLVYLEHENLMLINPVIVSRSDSYYQCSLTTSSPLMPIPWKITVSFLSEKDFKPDSLQIEGRREVCEMYRYLALIGEI